MKQNKVLSILILAIVVFGFWSFVKPKQDKTDFSERAKIALREVGNQLLLANKDSVSLILPILKIDDFKYQISFEKPLSFEPNTLVEIIKTVFDKTNFHKNYRVEVIEISSKEVAYSYEINVEEEQTIIPCAGRFLPENKYQIEVKFLGLKTSSNYMWLFYIFIPLILGILYRKFYSDKKTLETQEIVPENGTHLGIFQFFPEQNKLVKKAIEINLSKKECELLEIFVANPNKIIKREELTKKVWEDNGVFVGRSLDTYISKLRKILKEDENIKLINVHGVGYKLEIKK
ncbi:winged helix-turn-helix transcriptional regulator [Polaribacter haliotis]|uniref:Winged helix-turn-helix transcriptional regulator n=1 Tax=Polaribacter haliotis TaxID=1888915 RepID=A0A7L8ACZ2_9FLAO|nr:winged helix-turn-helix domain-containing protein [Polaribacter haliotis]QOD59870.1 winged helix-turn-helix transcriptional regulator [Polaribacter haliotis]